MNAIKKAILIVGSIILLMVVALVVLCMYALTRKAQNAQRIGPAMRNRWKDGGKPKEDDETIDDTEVDARPSAGSANGVGDSTDIPIRKEGGGTAE